MAGWLGSPFAVVPFGVGTPATSIATPTVPDATALYLDPRTRDYVAQTDGELSRMPRVRQQMLIALTTQAGSMSSNTAFGIVLPGKITETFARRMDLQVRRACRHVTDANIASVTTEVTAVGRVVVTVGYVDLSTGRNDQVTV